MNTLELLEVLQPFAVVLGGFSIAALFYLGFAILLCTYKRK